MAKQHHEQQQATRQSGSQAASKVINFKDIKFVNSNLTINDGQSAKGQKGKAAMLCSSALTDQAALQTKTSIEGTIM